MRARMCVFVLKSYYLGRERMKSVSNFNIVVHPEGLGGGVSPSDSFSFFLSFFLLLLLSQSVFHVAYSSSWL